MQFDMISSECRVPPVTCYSPEPEPETEPEPEEIPNPDGKLLKLQFFF